MTSIEKPRPSRPGLHRLRCCSRPAARTTLRACSRRQASADASAALRPGAAAFMKARAAIPLHRPHPGEEIIHALLQLAGAVLHDLRPVEHAVR